MTNDWDEPAVAQSSSWDDSAGDQTSTWNDTPSGDWNDGVVAAEEEAAIPEEVTGRQYGTVKVRSSSHACHHYSHLREADITVALDRKGFWLH